MDSVSKAILAIQAADQAIETSDENLDIVAKGRGAAAGHDYTLSEIATEVGLAESAYPAQNVKKTLDRAMKRFIRNYAFMLASKGAMAIGMTEDDAIDFAVQSYMIDVSVGKSDTEILRGWMDA
jgi:hypothetical protein